MNEDKNTAAAYEERMHRLLDLGGPLLVAGLYFASVISWIYGLVFGIVATTQCKLDANKRVGKICLILAAVNFVLIGCLVAAYILMIIFALGLYASAASPAGGG
jgi:hypothetical protein